MSYSSRAQSFDQDLQWSFLDQDAVPDVLRMALEKWNVDAATAWKAIQQKAAAGVVRAYRATDPATFVDLTLVSLEDAAEDFILFFAPAKAVMVSANATKTAESGL